MGMLKVPNNIICHRRRRHDTSLLLVSIIAEYTIVTWQCQLALYVHVASHLKTKPKEGKGAVYARLLCFLSFYADGNDNRLIFIENKRPPSLIDLFN